MRSAQYFVPWLIVLALFVQTAHALEVPAQLREKGLVGRMGPDYELTKHGAQVLSPIPSQLVQPAFEGLRQGYAGTFAFFPLENGEKFVPQPQAYPQWGDGAWAVVNDLLARQQRFALGWIDRLDRFEDIPLIYITLRHFHQGYVEPGTADRSRNYGHADDANGIFATLVPPEVIANNEIAAFGGTWGIDVGDSEYAKWRARNGRWARIYDRERFQWRSAPVGSPVAFFGEFGSPPFMHQWPSTVVPFERAFFRVSLISREGADATLIESPDPRLRQEARHYLNFFEKFDAMHRPFDSQRRAISSHHR